jgi:hypothetical protein
MSTLKLFAAAILASVVATPVLAQAVSGWSAGQVPNSTVGVVRKRPPRHRSES